MMQGARPGKPHNPRVAPHRKWRILPRVRDGHHAQANGATQHRLKTTEKLLQEMQQWRNSMVFVDS